VKTKRMLTLFLLMSFLLGLFLTPGWAKGVTLTFSNAGAIESDPATTEIMKAFERNTGNKVKIVSIPSPKMVEENYGTLARRESIFDVIEAKGEWLPDFIHSKWIASLEDVVSEQLKDEYSPGALIPATGPDGKLYALPWYCQPSVIFYRDDLVRGAGYENLPRGWDDFLSLCKKLTIDKNGDGMIDQYGFVYAGGPGKGAFVSFVRFLYTAGGDMYDEAENPIFNSQPGVDALQFMSDLKNKYGFSPETVIDYMKADCIEVWQAGKAATTFAEAGSMILQALDSPYGEQLKLAQLPSKSGKLAPSLTRVIYPVVNNKSKHIDEAKQLALWLTNYRSEWTSYLIEFNVPLYQTVFDSPYLKEQVPFSEEIGTASSLAKSPVHRGYAEIEYIVAREVRKVLMGEKSAKEALDDAVAQIKQREL